MKAEIELSERLRKACVEKGITEPRFVAQDQDGFWYHYNIKPKPLWTTWSCGRDVPGLGQTEPNKNWRETLMEFVTPKIEAGKRYWKVDGSISNFIKHDNFYGLNDGRWNYTAEGKHNAAPGLVNQKLHLVAEYTQENHE